MLAVSSACGSAHPKTTKPSSVASTVTTAAPLRPSEPPPAAGPQPEPQLAPPVGRAVYQPPAAAVPAPPTHRSKQTAASLRFIVGLGNYAAGWTLLVPGTAASDAELAEVAAMLRSAVPVTVAPPSAGPVRCGPSGLREVPTSPATPRWEIGLPTGGTVVVEPDIMPCNQTSMSYETDDYATIGGKPVKSVGLIPRLMALSQELPRLTPVVVVPTTVAPTTVVRLRGEGWVGQSVTLSVFWCHQSGPSDCTVRSLATVPVAASGRISWSGPLPADLPSDGSRYSVGIEAKDSALDYVATLHVQ
jgi:hypothetical protein